MQLTEHDIAYFKEVRKKMKDIGDRFDKLHVDSRSLCGACAFASYLVYKYLKKKGLTPYFVRGDGHCWVEVNNYIIDLTATQFGGPEILFIPVEDGKTLYYDYKENKEQKRRSKLGIRLMMIHWTYHNPFQMEKKPYKQFWNDNK